jgi:hypothetical protein
MRTGFALPQFGPSAAASPGGVARFAREAEALGAASLWAADRLLVPVRPSVGYGGTAAIPARFRSALDPFLVLATAAAVTTRPLLGFSVLNAPFYSPVLLARQLTTLDVPPGSPGRWSASARRPRHSAVPRPARSCSSARCRPRQSPTSGPSSPPPRRSSASITRWWA